MAAIDKEQRLAEEAAAAALEEEEKSASLDPLFPFQVEPFDPAVFSATPLSAL